MLPVIAPISRDCHVNDTHILGKSGTDVKMKV